MPCLLLFLFTKAQKAPGENIICVKMSIQTFQVTEQYTLFIALPIR